MNTVLLTPKNDEESLQIVKIAQAAGIPTLISKQPHGARLVHEKKLVKRLRKVYAETSDIVIVEIPGPEEEDMLRREGFAVHIIDHHRYDDLDRMKNQSSLEQFLTFFNIDDARLEELGFDARMVRAVGALDQGFVWELKRAGFAGEEYQQALAYYRALTLELGARRRLREERAAQIAWEAREERQGILIIRALRNEPSIRDAVSFLVAQKYPDNPPQTVVVQGSRRIYVQETPHAKALYERYGGFTFGGDTCWGILREDGDLPSEEEVLGMITD